MPLPLSPELSSLFYPHSLLALILTALFGSQPLSTLNLVVCRHVSVHIEVACDLGQGDSDAILLWGQDDLAAQTSSPGAEGTCPICHPPHGEQSFDTTV